MELVEIVVQGLKGAEELGRVPFQPGVTVLAAGVRERLYARLILDLLYPKGTEPTLLDLDMPGSQSRVALTLKGRDGQLYRLLHDAHTGRRALQRVVGDKAEPVTNSAGEIAQAVTATLGFPSEDILRELLFCAREDLPSKRPAKAVKGDKAGAAASSRSDKPLPPGFEGASKAKQDTGKPLPPGFSDEGAPVVDRAGRSDAQVKRRLAEIDALLSAQGNVKDLEFEIDGLQKKLFELDAKLRPLNTLKRSAQQAEEQLKGFKSIESVPGDLAEKGERLHQLRDEHHRELDRLEEEKQSLLASSKTIDASGRLNPMDVAQRDPFVKIGLAVGGGAILLGVVGAAAWPALRWVAFLDIPGLAVALYGGMRVLGSLEEGESIRRRASRIEQQQKKLEERFRIDETQVKGLLEKHGYSIEQLPELQDQLKARDEVRALVARTREALAEAQRGGDAAAFEREQSEVQARVRAIEDKLQTASAGMSSPGDLLAEKEELEAILRGDADAPSADATIDDAPATPTIEDLPEPIAAIAAIADDLGQRQLELAHDVLMVSVEEVAKMVQARASQILAALTDGRYREFRFGGRGETSAVDGAAGQPIAFGLLPPFDRDVAWLSLKVALIEVVARRGRVPVLFDRGLDALADSKGPILVKMLQFLAASTQVVTISENPALGGRPA